MRNFLIFLPMLIILSGCVSKEPAPITYIYNPCSSISKLELPEPVEIAVDPAYVDAYKNYIDEIRRRVKLYNEKIDRYNKEVAKQRIVFQ